MQPDSPSAPALSLRLQLVELLVFLLILLPLMALSALTGQPERLDFATVAIAVIVHDLALLALVLYFVWRNGEGIKALGWSRRSLAREAFIGLLLFAPIFFAVGVVEQALRAGGWSAPDTLPTYLVPTPGPEYALALVFLVVVAVTEETLFRGYLLLRFRAVTGSLPLALGISALIFAMGHGYQGSVGIVAVGLLGLLYALVYVWRGSLVAPTVMHFLQNFIGLFIAPLAQSA